MRTNHTDDVASSQAADAGGSRVPAATGGVRLRHRVALMFILALAVGSRLALVEVGPGRDLTRAYEPDSRRYVELATNLHTTGAFRRAEESSGVIHVPLAALGAERVLDLTVRRGTTDMDLIGMILCRDGVYNLPDAVGPKVIFDVGDSP